MHSPPEESAHRKNGVQLQVVRKLRRGHWPVEHELDLHGLSRAQAGPMLEAFLRDCAARRMKCVRVIHGKGQGVLKHAVRNALADSGKVMAYCEAPPEQGGGGAVLVLLGA